MQGEDECRRTEEEEGEGMEEDMEEEEVEEEEVRVIDREVTGISRAGAGLCFRGTNCLISLDLQAAADGQVSSGPSITCPFHCMCLASEFVEDEDGNGSEDFCGLCPKQYPKHWTGSK
jgi:hypothetical protein